MLDLAKRIPDALYTMMLRMKMEEDYWTICRNPDYIFHDDIDIKHHDMKNKWVLLTSSAEKALNNSTVRGVGMLLSPKAYKSLNVVETISPRTMIAPFNGDSAVTIISCYSHTNVSDEEDKDQFYFDVTTATRSIPKQHYFSWR